MRRTAAGARDADGVAAGGNDLPADDGHRLHGLCDRNIRWYYPFLFQKGFHFLPYQYWLNKDGFLIDPNYFGDHARQSSYLKVADPVYAGHCNNSM